MAPTPDRWQRDRWQQIESLYHAALERGRGALDGADPEFRREVESLLAAAPTGEGLLDQPAAELLAEAATIELKPGARLGPYQIEGLIGEGGMGKVYRARDTRLGRTVAIKTANARFSERFEREARAVGALNHPHICHLYDVGPDYLVMEYIEGTPFKGPFPLDEVLKYAEQICDALDAAHQKGIIHRDLKPGNILLTKRGIKLLDFGIAQMEPRPEDPTYMPTRGVVGTPAYMAPEQLEGTRADARSDIYSFGCVLHEMVTGKRVSADRAPVASPFENILRTCLEKDPDERWQTARELKHALRWAAAAPAEAKPVPTTPFPAAPAHWPVIAIAALCVAVLLAGVWWFRRPASEAARQVVQFDIAFPPGTVYAPTVSRQSFSISPDGRKLVFVATTAEGTHVWLREFDAPDMHPLPGTEGAWSVFWAPDSRSVYFSVKKTLRQVNLDSGAVRAVVELPDMAQFAAWRSPSDVVLYHGPGSTSDLHLVDGSFAPGRHLPGLRWPQFLPGGQTILYSAYDGKEKQSHVMTAGYVNGQPVTLTPTDSRAEYSPPSQSGSPGYLLLIRGGTLLAQPFDAQHLRVTGQPAAVAQKVIYYGPNLSASFSSSDTGVLVYQANFPTADLKWYDLTGKEAGTAGASAAYWGNVRLSRDGRRVAAAVVSAETGSTSVWTFDADGTNSRRVTFPPEVFRRPTWSPDGTHLAVGRSGRVGPPQASIVDLVGGGSPLGFTSDSGEHLSLPTDWSSDGRFIAFDDGVGEEQRVVWIGDANTRRQTPLLKGEFAYWGGAFAPGVDQIAFASAESGRPEVYLQDFEASPAPHVAGERHAVSGDGAWLVRWRADGKELFYLGLDNVLYAVEVHGKGQIGKPKALFRVPGIPQFATSRDFQFDVSPDGKRFILPATGSVVPPPFTVVENWQSRFSAGHSKE